MNRASPSPVLTEERSAAVNPAGTPRHLVIVPGPATMTLSASALNGALDCCLERGIGWLSVGAEYVTDADLAAFCAHHRASLAARKITVSSPGPAQLQPVLNGNERLIVNLIRSGGRQEVVDALRQIAGERASGCGGTELTAERLHAALPSANLPPVDLVIYTGGRTALSDILLWHCAYAELLFVTEPWEQFRSEHYTDALADYARRKRTYGGLSAR